MKSQKNKIFFDNLTFFAVGIFNVIAIAFFNDRAIARPSNIVPDRTLGNENSVVIPNVPDANGEEIEVITGGAQRGQNLFHSFREFNVSEGRGAYFLSPDRAIQNILTRVTGSNPSEIMGVLGTFGNSQPNLFLINPNGIIFGQNASLNIQGSFVATTANAIQFGDRGVFSASNLNSPPLLTVKPSAFLFNQIATQQPSITINSGRIIGFNRFGNPIFDGLRVPDGQSLLLLGGNVNMNSGILNAYGGRVELGGLSGEGTVKLNAQGNNLSLNFPDNAARANVSLNNSLVDVTAGGGGSIAIASRNLKLVDSTLLAGIGFGLGSAQAQAGNITIQAAENITIQGDRSSSFISNLVFPKGVGKAGEIIINARSLSLTNGSLVSSATLSEGKAGEIIINARSLSLTNDSQVSSATLGQGKAGEIIINARSLFLTNGSQVSSSTLGQGAGGNLTVNASDSVRLIGTSTNGQDVSGLFAVTQNPGNGGKGGSLSINTNNLIVSDGAQVRTNTRGQGAGGSLTIHADSIRLIGRSADGRFASSLFASSESTDNGGDGGNLSIDTSNLILLDGARISSATENDGDAGNLRIDTGNLIVSDGSLVVSGTRGKGAGGDLTVNADSIQLIGTSADGAVSGLLTQTQNDGDAGDLRIDTRNLILRDGARVSSSTFDKGAGGNLIVTSDSVRLIGESANGVVSGLFASSENPGNGGKAGNLRIETGNLILLNGAQVSSSTRGQGEGGSLTVNARDSVRIIGRSASGLASGLFAATLNTGNGRDLSIKTRNLILHDRAQVASSTEGQGASGNLTINADDLIVSDGSQIISGTRGQGAGGNLTVDADSIRLIGTSADGKLASGLFASSENPGNGGNAGNLRIETGNLILLDGAQVSSGTEGQGAGGNLTVNADSIQLIGTSPDGVISALATQTENDGDAGNLSIDTRNLILRDGARISSGTEGQGAGGNLTIHATDSVRLIGASADGVVSGLFTGSENLGSGGKAGNLSIDTRNLILLDGAQVFSGTEGRGAGGSLTVNASDSVQLIGSSADGDVSSLLTLTLSDGDAGKLSIDTNNLIVRDGAFVSSGTLGQGAGGRLIVDAADSIQLIGTSADGQFASTLTATTTASGDAGNLTLKTGQFIIEDGGLVSSRSTGTGIAGDINIKTRSLSVNNADIAVDSLGTQRGGNIDIQADSLTLDRGTISAETASNTGGNINLEIDDLLSLGNNSQISTTAGIAGAGGDGGNIDINAKFIVAVPNEDSNITANAFEGQGGRINLTAQGIFGLQSRNNNTNLSDITADSQLGIDGVVQIDAPDTDPSQGVVNLPSNVVDASQLIDQRCLGGGATANQQGEFVMTGRGGIPANPREPLPGEAVLSADWLTLDTETESNVEAETSSQSESVSSQPIIEAQGWVVDRDGKIILTAQVPTATPNDSGFAPHSCPVEVTQ